MVLKDKYQNCKFSAGRICPFSVLCSWTFWVYQRRNAWLWGAVLAKPLQPYKRMGYQWKDLALIFHLVPCGTLYDHWFGHKWLMKSWSTDVVTELFIYLMSILYSLSDKVVEENAIVGKAWFSFYPQKVADTMYKVKRDKSFPGVCRYGRWCHSKSLRLLPLILIFSVLSPQKLLSFLKPL